MIEVRNNGIPLLEQRRAAITLAFQELAARLNGEISGEGGEEVGSASQSSSSSSWLNFWPKSKS